ncbi:MAG: hypothetical protein A2289_23710 [Deltaproteobacteria bacterium RIFOXYA12_FULL_58_15]|nr:MAG: hypothetical protein A2289_23710 [Deltaproteobacteria bacterium RIFOXYA12_FULL_58_15]OGR08783.1 MAG: hypothetical protein A2341_10215 [Deltaproteobacteria bacterium RIFOXYB12_FULL_58_9]
MKLVWFVVAMAAGGRVAHAEIQIFVMNVELSPPNEGLSASFTEVIASSVQKHSGFGALSSRDLDSILYIGRQQALANCSDKQCMTEIVAALGAELYLATNIHFDDGKYVLNLKLIDTQEVTVLSRASDTVDGDTAVVVTALRKAVADLLNDFPDDWAGGLGNSGNGSQTVEEGSLQLEVDPQPAGRVALLWGAIGSITAGAALTATGLTFAARAQDEKKRYDRLNTNNTRSEFDSAFESYRRKQNLASTMHWISFGLYGVGLTLGAWWWFFEPTESIPIVIVGTPTGGMALWTLQL